MIKIGNLRKHQNQTSTIFIFEVIRNELGTAVWLAVSWTMSSLSAGFAADVVVLSDRFQWTQMWSLSSEADTGGMQKNLR